MAGQDFFDFTSGFVMCVQAFVWSVRVYEDVGYVTTLAWAGILEQRSRTKQEVRWCAVFFPFIVRKRC